MAKGKKKKKDLDFQKVKLKVGRKLKRDDNETKAEFHSRKIILKEVKSYSDDPLTALSRHSDNISHNGKLAILNHFRSALTPDIVKSLNKPILDSLSKFIVDHSDQVRAATFRCLKSCLNHTRQQHLSTKAFMQSLKPYLDCAYTHVSKGISSDCHKFLDHLVNVNDPQTFEPLMMIVLRRYEAGNLTAEGRSLAIKLRQYYLRSKQKELVEEMLSNEQVDPVYWTETNFLLDLDSNIHEFDRLDQEREVLLVEPIDRQENIVDRYIEIVKDDGEQPAEASTKKKSLPFSNSYQLSTKKRRFT